MAEGDIRGSGDPYAWGNALDWECPTCGAEPGRPCKLPDHPELRGLSHAARDRIVKPKRRRKGKKRGSVRAIPTAFESNRRRH